MLNPYQGFIDLNPAARIQNGVLVYEGIFQVPLASSLGFVQVSATRLKAKDYEGAVAAAQQAVAIDPDGFDPLVPLGDALVAAGRPPEANATYAHALEVANTMEPEAQQIWEPVVRKKIGS